MSRGTYVRNHERIFGKAREQPTYKMSLIMPANKPMKPVTSADLLAEFLKNRGVRHVFGLPGGENVILLDALRRAGLQFVLMHHEACAGFAADVMGQLADIPGVCLATLGPGAANLLAGAASATLERSPMLAITAEADAELAGRVTHMQLDLARLFSTVCKASFSLDPQGARATLESAWRLATTPPFGAVHLAVSPAVAGAPVVNDNPGESVQVDAPFPDLQAVRARLRDARQLLILAGVGVEMAGAQQALQALAEAWRVPVAVTPKALGHFPTSHPLYAGCFSAYGDQALQQALTEADLILGVGLDGVDFVPSLWEIPTPLVNLSPGGAADPVTRPVVAIDGPLAAMLAALEDTREPQQGGLTQAARVRDQIKAALETHHPRQEGKIRLLPLIHTLRGALPPEGVVTVDVGVFKLVFLQAWQAYQPKTLFVANGLSAMGYAVPGALAVSLARPEVPCVAIVGDGALHMYAGELATLARLHTPVVVLVVVDRALALIRLKQRRHGVPVYGTEFGATDYGALARAFGLAYACIDREEGAEHILSSAIQARHPTLVEARLDLAEYEHFK